MLLFALWKGGFGLGNQEREMEGCNGMREWFLFLYLPGLKSTCNRMTPMISRLGA